MNNSQNLARNNEQIDNTPQPGDDEREIGVGS